MEELHEQFSLFSDSALLAAAPDPTLRWEHKKIFSFGFKIWANNDNYYQSTFIHRCQKIEEKHKQYLKISPLRYFSAITYPQVQACRWRVPWVGVRQQDSWPWKERFPRCEQDSWPWRRRFSRSQHWCRALQPHKVRWPSDDFLCSWNILFSPDSEITECERVRITKSSWTLTQCETSSTTSGASDNARLVLLESDL